MENNHKEQWIDEVLGSTQGVQRAQPGPGFMQGIEARLHANTGKKVLSLPAKWAAAAILLLAVNIGSVLYATEGKHSAANSTQNPLATDIPSQTIYNY